jgi:SAM-dependent methyltransferase
MNRHSTDWWLNGKTSIVLDLIKMRYNHRAKICDIGAGTGMMLDRLKQNGYGSLTATDYHPKALAILDRKGFVTIHSKLPEIKTTKKYDLCLLLDVLEHVKNDGEALVNIKRILNKKGRLLITVPAFQFLWTKKDNDLMHVRRYDKKNLEALIIDSGYKIEMLGYFNFLLFPIAIIYTLLKKGSVPIKRYGSPFRDKLFYKLFSSERIVLKNGWTFPFGVSLIAIIRRK